MFGNKKVINDLKASVTSLQKKLKDGYINVRSGAGSHSDKSQSSYFTSDGIANSEVLLQQTYLGSWAAAKIIDIPVDDMFILPRQVSGLDDNNLNKVTSFYTNLNLDEKIKDAIKAARLYGTAFLVLISNDDVLQSPLNMNSALLSLSNVLVIDRFHTNIVDYDTDITSINYNKPLFYKFNLPRSSSINVHYSRVIRIDGIKPLTVNNWSGSYGGCGSYIEDWGISELIRVMSSIRQEEGISNDISNLIAECSIPIIKINELSDSLSGALDSASIDDIISEINMLKSNYRTTYLDSTMDISRLEASFANIPALFDRYHAKLAAAADIPQTRFFGKSPTGLNSNGDSDMHNYAIKVASTQERMLKPIYDKLDNIIIKSLKIKDFIKYSFKPLINISDSEISQTELQNAQRDQIYLTNGILTEEEVRQNLSDNKTYNDIDAGFIPVDIDKGS